MRDLCLHIIMSKAGERMQSNIKKQNATHDPGQQDVNARLARVIAERAHETGITVDPARTSLIDDGIWIEKNPSGRGWIIRTYIADVPAMVPDENQFIRGSRRNPSEGRKQGRPQGENNDLLRNFSNNFLGQYISLNQGKTRPVVAFTMHVSDQGELQSYKIDRKAFTSLRKCHTGQLQRQFKSVAGDVDGWYRLAYRMQDSRLHAMAADCDRIAAPGSSVRMRRARIVRPSAQQSEVLVQELMRLTNAVASDYLRNHNLTVPYKYQPSYFITQTVSEDKAFDDECDRKCQAIIDAYTARKAPKIRLSSPMRIHSDYITMQILVQHMAGREISPVLKKEAQRLSAIFRMAANDNVSTRTHPDWATQKLVQGCQHPFDTLSAQRGDIHSTKLDRLSRERGWERPDVAVRKLYVQGGYCYLVGIQLRATGDPSGECNRTWASALKYHDAREMAAQRLLKDISKDLAGEPGLRPAVP